MAKATGSYESIIRGVSQQVPHDRLPGQHWLQDNFISDPVRGLARRHGSVMLHEKKRPTLTLNTATKQDMAKFKETSFFLGGREYSLTYRAEAKVGGSTMPGLIAVDKDSGTILEVLAPAGDAIAASVLEQGLTSVTTVGQFVIMAARNRVTNFYETDMLATTQQYATVWVKGGAYSRKYTITIYPTGTGAPIVASYTTPASYYEGVLNTSDLNPAATDYQKQVNDRVNAYNTAVNQHIASSGRAIQPDNIAESLRVACVAAGYSDANRSGSHLHFSGVRNVVVDDGGNGQFLKAAATEVESIADLTARHMVGKTIRVTPQQTGLGNQMSYYMTARAATPGLSGWQGVIWEEGPGLRVTPQFMFLLGWVNNGTLYVGSTPAQLASITALTDIPDFSVSAAGDADSSPVPQFLGRQIDHIRTFQDRLMIVSGSTVFLSKSGDYFNFFRTSVLTVADDDPIEVFAEGSEGDVITASVSIDRNLLLFGNRNQYAMPGREAITPKNAYIAVQSAHEDTAVAPPVASGNLIFFAQQRSNRLTVQQMQTGAYADSFDSFDVTTQLDGYLIGRPRQIVAMTSPQQLFIRTEEFTNGVFVFGYLDAAGEERRLFDSWSRWVWDESLGPLVSISSTDSSLLTLTARQGKDGVYLVLDKFVREARKSPTPYLDSQRTFSATTGTIQPGWVGDNRSAVVFNDKAGDEALLGRPIAEYATLFETVPGKNAYAVAGTYFTSQFEPTSPYIRDDKDKAILDGRLTVGRKVVTVSESAALLAYVRSSLSPEEEVVNWVYRPAGLWQLNKQQIAATASVTIPVMKESRDYRLRITSRNWLPLTIASIEWQGQFFTSRRS